MNEQTDMTKLIVILCSFQLQMCLKKINRVYSLLCLTKHCVIEKRRLWYSVFLNLYVCLYNTVNGPIMSKTSGLVCNKEVFLHASWRLCWANCIQERVRWYSLLRPLSFFFIVCVCADCCITFIGLNKIFTNVSFLVLHLSLKWRT